MIMRNQLVCRPPGCEILTISFISSVSIPAGVTTGSSAATAEGAACLTGAALVVDGFTVVVVVVVVVVDVVDVDVDSDAVEVEVVDGAALVVDGAALVAEVVGEDVELATASIGAAAGGGWLATELITISTAVDDAASIRFSIGKSFADNSTTGATVVDVVIAVGL